MAENKNRSQKTFIRQILLVAVMFAELLAGFYFYQHPWIPGIAIAILAFLAFIFPLIPDKIGHTGKFAGVLALLILSILESHNIAVDQAQRNQTQKMALDSQQAGFEEILSENQQQFSKTLAESQDIASTAQESLSKLVASELQAPSDTLIPANDPTPPIPSQCASDIPPNSVDVFYGNTVVFVTQFPYVLIEFYGHPIITANRDAEGNILLTADVRDSNHEVVAEINQNEFVVNTNDTLPLSRPDRSTLVVYDQNDNPVLYFRYLNPHAIELLGSFYSLPGDPDAEFSIQENLQTINWQGQFNMTDGCFENNPFNISSSSLTIGG